ncbi:MAG: 23S rRNA (uracil(1939)-C(5))-methyltransferase RlmD [Desulfobacteraceae bacterium]|nr:23S rRNA (uracil(1939)-C(5))-methyltransferase RlmD [Desulfobacteraceae bacterium]
MEIKKRKAYEFEIIDLAFGGKGLAKPDGFPVFIDRALPGDKVFAKVVKKKKNFAEAKLIEILEKSPEREKSLCKYASYCGGCKWQELPYEAQLEYKKNHVKESLEHIAGLDHVNVKDVKPSANIYQYRNKMEFSCSDKRWLLPEELSNPDIKKDFGLGLHVPGTFDRVINLERCEIQPELGNQIMEEVRAFIKSSGLPAYGLRSHEGFWRFLMLRHSYHFDKWMVNIVTAQENDELLKKLAIQLIEKFPQIDSVVNNVTSRKAGVAIGEYEKLLAGKSYIKEKLGDYTFKISANSFFQTNTKGAESLYSIVSQYANLTGKERVLDLYSGTGTIPIWLSKDAKEIVGIEIIESAVEDARKNAQLNNITNLKFLIGDIKDVLPSFKQISNEIDVMIIDPPRAGMHKDVLSQVLMLLPEKIVYVSCNPATLARDLEHLCTKYDVLEVQPVDMFPHTFHIESVANLSLKTK